jgi:hypothetical protein
LYGTERASMQTQVDAQLRAVQQSGADLVAFQAESAAGLASGVTGPTLTAAGTRARKLVSFAAFAAIAAALGIVLVAFFFLAKKGGTGGPHANQEPAKARVVITAVPDSAKIYWDDAPLSGNPAVVTFTRDNLSHRVRAEAPGFARKAELVALDSSQVTMELDLEPLRVGDETDPFGNKLTTVTMRATPSSALLYLDGVLLPTNPSITRYPRDNKPHEIKAEATGFLPKTHTVTFDKITDTITVELSRDPKASSAPPIVVATRHTGPRHGPVDRNEPPTNTTTAPTGPAGTTAVVAPPEPQPQKKVLTIDRTPL